MSRKGGTSPSDMVSPHVADAAVVALWASLVFGLGEGLVRAVTRLNPRLFAAHKVSLDVLWVAPAVDVFVFVAATIAVPLGHRAVRRWIGDRAWPALFAVPLFLGFVSLLHALAVLHWTAVLLLGGGLASASLRTMAGSEGRLARWLRRRWLVAPVALVVIAAAVQVAEIQRERGAAERLPPAVRSTNVLVVVLDTVRADEFDRLLRAPALPSFGRLATSGIYYPNGWVTSSWSLPSHASILTGAQPARHGADWPSLELAEATPTLGETLAREGYATGAFSGNSSWITPEYLGRGFLRFDAYSIEHVARRTAYGRLLDRVASLFNRSDAGHGRRASEINRELFAFVDDYPDRPFFAYLCYMDVNQATYRRQFDSSLWHDASKTEMQSAYRQAIVDLDSEISALVEGLKQRGRFEDTILVITSDHGESFWPAEPGDHEPSGHGGSLYPEQTRVPLILRVPPATTTGAVVTVDVSTIRIVPTILARLGFDRGRYESPLPGTADASNTAAPPILTTLRYLDRDQSSVITNGHMLLRRVADGATAEELFDLRADPKASSDLPADDPMRSVLRTFLEALLAQPGQS